MDFSVVSLTFVSVPAPRLVPCSPPLSGRPDRLQPFRVVCRRRIYALVWATVCLSLAWHWFYLPTQAGPDTRLGTMVPVALGSVVFSALREVLQTFLSGSDPERAPCELPANPPAKRGS